MVGDFAEQRRAMVQHQLVEQGVRDPRVLEAMERVPREEFVPEDLWHRAYDPTALEIGDGQTISQPYMVGSMTEALQLTGNERVLEIGTGSGYQAAVLAWLGVAVVTVDRYESLARSAARVLRRLGLTTVEQVVGDGSAPHFLDCAFDRILVTAAAPAVPSALLDHLSVGGRLVCPTGDAAMQRLSIVDRRSGGLAYVDGHGLPFRAPDRRAGLPARSLRRCDRDPPLVDSAGCHRCAGGSRVRTGGIAGKRSRVGA